MVSNPTGRSSVDDYAGLVTNADGSVDIPLQPQALSGLAQNWLPTPTGRFKLTDSDCGGCLRSTAGVTRRELRRP
jgi:hypothetical protein